MALPHIQKTPGHCDIQGNVLADLAAKFASTYLSIAKTVTYSKACAAIRKVTRGARSFP